jgi:hypothetical protein
MAVCVCATSHGVTIVCSRLKSFCVIQDISGYVNLLQLLRDDAESDVNILINVINKILIN